jgi:hypothetical protein
VQATIRNAIAAAMLAVVLAVPCGAAVAQTAPPKVAVSFVNKWPSDVVVVQNNADGSPGTSTGQTLAADPTWARPQTLMLDPGKYAVYAEANPYENRSVTRDVDSALDNPIRTFSTDKAPALGSSESNPVEIRAFDVLLRNKGTQAVAVAVVGGRALRSVAAGGEDWLPLSESDFSHQVGASQPGTSVKTCNAFRSYPGRNVWIYTDACARKIDVAPNGVTVNFMNNWPDPVVLAEVGARNRGIALSASVDHELVLKPNTDYAVYEGRNPAWTGAMPGQNSEPLVEFHTGTATMRLPTLRSAMLVISNNTSRPLRLWRLVDNDDEELVGSIDPWQRRSFSAIADTTFAIVPTFVGYDSAQRCMQTVKMHPGRAYLAYPAPELPCDFVQPPPSLVDQNRKYNEQSYLMAHNAAENRADGWWWYQQSASMSEQFTKLGVRAIELDVNWWSRESIVNPDTGFVEPAYPDDFYICHEACPISLAAVYPRQLNTLTAALGPIRGFLEDARYTKEVLTVFIELRGVKKADYRQVGAALMERLNNAGVLGYVYWPDRPGATGDDNACLRAAQQTYPNLFPANDPKTVSGDQTSVHDWPLISDMVKSNRRLVLFVSDGTTRSSLCVPYTWRYVQENSWEGYGTDAKLLAPRTESAPWLNEPRTLMRFNHFPSGFFSSVAADYAEVNDGDTILARIAQWKAAYLPTNAPASVEGPDSRGYGRRLPNFVALDFVEAGQGLQLIKALNECWRNAAGNYRACVENEQTQSDDFTAGKIRVSFTSRWPRRVVVVREGDPPGDNTWNVFPDKDPRTNTLYLPPDTEFWGMDAVNRAASSCPGSTERRRPRLFQFKTISASPATEGPGIDQSMTFNDAYVELTNATTNHTTATIKLMNPETHQMRPQTSFWHPFPGDTMGLPWQDSGSTYTITTNPPAQPCPRTWTLVPGWNDLQYRGC